MNEEKISKEVIELTLKHLSERPGELYYIFKANGLLVKIVEEYYDLIDAYETKY